MAGYGEKVPLTIPDGFAYHQVYWSLAGTTHPQIVTFGTEWTGQVADDIQDVANFVATTFDTNITQNCADVLTQQKVISHGMDGVTEWAAENTTPSNSGVTLEAPPANFAVLVKKNTSLVGKGLRGRMYLPGAFIGEAEVNAAGEIDGPDVTTLQSFVTPIFTAFAARTPALDLYILHADVLVDPGPPKVYEPSDVPPTRITSLAVQNVGATQRRRMR